MRTKCIRRDFPSIFRINIYSRIYKMHPCCTLLKVYHQYFSTQSLKIRNYLVAALNSLSSFPNAACPLGTLYLHLNDGFLSACLRNISSKWLIWKGAIALWFYDSITIGVSDYWKCAVSPHRCFAVNILMGCDIFYVWTKKKERKISKKTMKWALETQYVSSWGFFFFLGVASFQQYSSDAASAQ